MSKKFVEMNDAELVEVDGGEIFTAAAFATVCAIIAASWGAYQLGRAVGKAFR